MRLRLLFIALVLATALAYAQHVALEHFLYWRYPWFDTFMHFLGGLTLAVFLIAVFRRARPRLFLLGMIGVAVGWEAFELLIGTEREANFVLDTSLDLLMDTLGAVAAYALARFTVWRSA
ncbi:MAG TPA: hypothetical protein VHO23_00930 [Candidatus Paceibacterota bacterium]|nr:hypothetical protein [Candidatus Paceibacterota bacterium]